MFEENDDIENELSNDNELSEEEDIVDQLNADDDENVNPENDGFKLLTFKNILENIEKTPKKTVPFLSKFERARITGVRLQQLAYGAKPRINTENLRSIQEIVQEELIQRKLPFIIRRTLPNGTTEDWKMEEFEMV
jgi:DNA-directed RNA polymerase I, II, and III subunit RPABC2